MAGRLYLLATALTDNYEVQIVKWFNWRVFYVTLGGYSSISRESVRITIHDSCEWNMKSASDPFPLIRTATKTPFDSVYDKPENTRLTGNAII